MIVSGKLTDVVSDDSVVTVTNKTSQSILSTFPLVVICKLFVLFLVGSLLSR